MLTFLPGSQVLALAGLAAAAAPLVIHLLNRQRYRLLDWAAMDFLLEAASRSRSLLQLRDVLLLLLRTAAVALFGLAVARPYFASRAGATAGGGAVHAVLVIDNSLSMGRERLGGDGTTQLLDDARARAKEFVGRLPPGSRISVLPLCGPAGSFSFDPRRSVEDAAEAIDAIKVVDRAGPASLAIDMASRALALAPDLQDKRVVFIGDQQGVNWPADASTLAAVGEGAAEGTEARSDGMQVVSVRPPDSDNTWVESLRLEDGIGDLEAPARFTAVVRHQGTAPRTGVQATLSIDGADVATEMVDLDPGQSRELLFSHQFDAAPSADRPALATVQVSLPPDRLPGDDSRCIVVPVVASLPVVFADQFGSGGEQPRLNRYGETRHLRRLLAPVVARSADTKALVDVRHVRLEQVDRDLLADVRLAVIAGVRAPGDVVPVLREFVEQGGRLVIAAGADFDVEEWNSAGWADGAGILPLPLTGTVGRLPDEADELRPFMLDWRSMKDQSLFRVPGATEEELADLYETPLFFKAVSSGAASDLATIAAADVRRAAEGRGERGELAEKISRLTRLESQGQARAEDREALRQAREALGRLTPAWLTWADLEARETPDEQLGPRVLAAFEGGEPYLVSRRIGRGQVVWVSSGLFSPWNNLPRTNAMLLFDRLLRSLLAETLPNLTVDTADQFTLPLPASSRRDTVRVTRPDGSTESLPIEALGGDAYGVTLRDMTQRGVYTLVGTRPDLADKEKRESTAWKVPLAANGPARESQPELLDATSFAARAGRRDDFRWVDAGAPISVDGARVSGQGSWWWLLLAALGCLVAENVVLARSNREAAPAGGNA
jgi:hypothetical protein